MEERIKRNAGYEIVERIRIHDQEYVIGKNISNDNGAKYVVWAHIKGYYYYGFYTNKYEQALKNMYERAKEDIERRIDVIEKPF